MNTAGMSALSVALPATIRRNEYWRVHHPEMVAAAEEHALARLWASAGEGSTFENAMAPFAGDPFKGSTMRHVAEGDDASVGLHAQAIEGVLECWPGTIDDFDFAIISSMRPDSIAVGDASWLARTVGLTCPAVNLETACSSALMAFDFACSLVETDGRIESWSALHARIPEMCLHPVHCRGFSATVLGRSWSSPAPTSRPRWERTAFPPGKHVAPSSMNSWSRTVFPSCGCGLAATPVPSFATPPNPICARQPMVHSLRQVSRCPKSICLYSIRQPRGTQISAAMH